ncbi:hypothetical protein [Aquitalea magnusonii]|uniref:Uncharacterized protein n=1 Tax=Aquitalea magnusonii TaxID=332411 RepID=A0A318K8N8_9NEIS|nr:hypothetical protein [Aquitalea magnusonii]PXX51038.1 hypothetical protein DFR38_10195 [Aquitalea magnusonii]
MNDRIVNSTYDPKTQAEADAMAKAAEAVQVSPFPYGQMKPFILVDMVDGVPVATEQGWVTR